MSSDISLCMGGDERVVYTVEHRNNCVLISGSVPASAFSTLAKLVPTKSVMDNDVARIYGVTFAFGMPDDLQALRKAGASRAERVAREQYPDLPSSAITWLASGQRGASSEALFTRLSGVNATRGASHGVASADHPHDAGDFRRCRLMLEACPELAANMKNETSWTPEWDALFAVWDKLCAAMDAETPNWRTGHCGTGPQTHKLIQQAIGRAPA